VSGQGIDFDIFPDKTVPYARDYEEAIRNHNEVFCPRCKSQNIFVKSQIAADLHQANEIMQCRDCLGRDGQPTQWRNVYIFQWIEMTDDPIYRW
jgi:phage FluMu protein Com